MGFTGSKTRVSRESKVGPLEDPILLDYLSLPKSLGVYTRDELLALFPNEVPSIPRSRGKEGIKEEIKRARESAHVYVEQYGESLSRFNIGTLMTVYEGSPDLYLVRGFQCCYSLGGKFHMSFELVQLRFMADTKGGVSVPCPSCVFSEDFSVVEPRWKLPYRSKESIKELILDLLSVLD